MQFSRREQVASAATALDQHRSFGEAIRKARQSHLAQTSQLQGLYEETDKLTKGKSIVPPSDLIVEVVNAQITDAKAHIFRDTYLDRLKVFVPAGNNPSYPDILLSLRILQQISERFASMLAVETAKHLSTGTELQTVVAALKVAEQDEVNFESEDTDEDESAEPEADNDEPEDPDIEEDELASNSEEIEYEDDDSENNDDDSEENEGQTDEYVEYVSKSEVRRKLDGPTSDVWFRKYGDDSIFDFQRLDRLGIPSYEPPIDGITYLLIPK